MHLGNPHVHTSLTWPDLQPLQDQQTPCPRLRSRARSQDSCVPAWPEQTLAFRRMRLLPFFAWLGRSQRWPKLGASNTERLCPGGHACPVFSPWPLSAAAMLHRSVSHCTLQQSPIQRAPFLESRAPGGSWGFRAGRRLPRRAGWRAQRQSPRTGAIPNCLHGSLPAHAQLKDWQACPDVRQCSAGR